MPASDELVFDTWTPLSFKRALGAKTQVGGTSWLAPRWVGDHARRLQAYKVLAAYLGNAARFFLQTTDLKVRDAHREYGDAALMRGQILAALLGDEQQISVPGADSFEEDPEDSDEVDDEARRAFELQEWVRQWAVDERFQMKLIENERNAVGLGDGVYTLGWSPEKGRVRLRVWDPGFYFPVLDDGNEDDFPRTVHMAWELESDKPGKRLVRRITWQLGPIGFVPGTNEVGAERIAEVQHPWNEEPTGTTCYMTDATWEFDVAGKQTVEDFTEGRAIYGVYTTPDGTEIPWRNIDLGIDFLPVIHEPNTVALLDHFGQSSIATILQILDDLANADTDLQAASSTTGTPPIALSGARQGENKPSYRPGEVWFLGENGKLSILDTSAALDALIKYIQFLLKRLSVNGRVPETLLGRTEITGNIAGITMALSFGPLETMVKEMRLVRSEKYPLLFKFAHRMTMAAGAEAPEVFDLPIELQFGSFLPDDIDTTIQNVTTLLQAKAISLETAVLLLFNAGMPIEDAAEEVRRIQERDFAGASELLDATGDEAAVFDYLGRDQPADLGRPAPPVPTLPILPGEV